MKSKFDPKYILFENALVQDSEILYPCIKSLESQPLEKVEKHSTALQPRISPKISGLKLFLRSELRKIIYFLISECIKKSLQLSRINFSGLHFPEKRESQRFSERFKASNLYLNMFLHLLQFTRFSKETSNLDQNY